MDIIEQALNQSRDRLQGGIWPQSTNREYFIFCVGQEPDAIHNFLHWASAANINVKPLLGCYQGTNEYSFIANINDYDKILPFLRLEETVLVIKNYDRFGHPEAYLVDIATGKDSYCGRLRPVTRSIALQSKNWTYDMLQDQYFTTIK